ncbi:MAG: ATP-binding protein [Gammaproteobacteria bacterium]|nr:ATP-binding protein [Gammaproteobacteria bacterium]
MTQYRPRELASQVHAALSALPVAVVTGLRQAGKTTFIRQDPAFRGRRYVTLDDFAMLAAAQRDPDAMIAGDQPLTIDEVQRCPDLLMAVKRAVDRQRVPGQFLLSGSANLTFLQGVSESLAGRALYLVLHPFTRRERRGSREKPFLVKFLKTGKLPPSVDIEAITENEILDGGMPSIILGKTANREYWLLGYEQTYLERDVRRLSQVTDLISFRNLLRLAALHTGQLLNQSDLARDARLPASAVTRYLGLLETSFVIKRLPPYLKSRISRLLKTPKLFVSDAGLAAHLNNVTELAPAADEPLRGSLFETWVLQNLTGILGAHLPRAELFCWNVQGRHEVDFIISAGRSSVAIEVKAAQRFQKRDLAGLRAFAAKTPGFHAGILAYNGTEAVALGERLFAIPLALLIS